MTGTALLDPRTTITRLNDRSGIGALRTFGRVNEFTRRWFEAARFASLYSMGPRKFADYIGSPTGRLAVIDNYDAHRRVMEQMREIARRYPLPVYLPRAIDPAAHRDAARRMVDTDFSGLELRVLAMSDLATKDVAPVKFEQLKARNRADRRGGVPVKFTMAGLAYDTKEKRK